MWNDPAVDSGQDWKLKRRLREIYDGVVDFDIVAIDFSSGSSCAGEQSIFANRVPGHADGPGNFFENFRRARAIQRWSLR